MRILFTTSNSLLSRAIRRSTGEPVSHCAIEMGGLVIHSNLRGVNVEPLSIFAKHSQIVYTAEVGGYRDRLLRVLSANWGSEYDVGALLYLGLRYLLPFLPGKNLWSSSAQFLCVEWVTEVLWDKQEAMLTPYQLYLRLIADPVGQSKGE